MSEQAPTEEKTKLKVETTADNWIVVRCSCCHPPKVLLEMQGNRVRKRCKYSKKMYTLTLPRHSADLE